MTALGCLLAIIFLLPAIILVDSIETVKYIINKIKNRKNKKKNLSDFWRMSRITIVSY